MFDLIIPLDGRSYCDRKELMSYLGLQQKPDINGDERYTKGKINDKQFIIADLTKDLSGYFYGEETPIPYKISGVCHFTFYPFCEVINELLSAVINFNSDLFVDDDCDNIMNICDYKNLVKKEKVYPFTYSPKDVL